MRNKIICAVTGKSIESIGNGRSETYYKNVDIKWAITEKVGELIEGGVTDFLCNAEYGFPLWACEIILSLRDIRKIQGLPAPRLHLVMSHEEQAADWDDDVHERFYTVHEKADKVLILHRQYCDDCHERSERFMIDQCDFLYTDSDEDFAWQYAWLHEKPTVINTVKDRAYI